MDASSAAMAASRALNVSMLAFSSPSSIPLGVPPELYGSPARREVRSCSRAAGLTPGMGEGRRSPASSPLKEADDDRAHYQVDELDSAGRSTR
jgi:hypothetical protein